VFTLLPMAIGIHKQAPPFTMISIKKNQSSIAFGNGEPIQGTILVQNGKLKSLPDPELLCQTEAYSYYPPILDLIYIGKHLKTRKPVRSRNSSLHTYNQFQHVKDLKETVLQDEFGFC
jgi:hypothetical protein